MNELLEYANPLDTPPGARAVLERLADGGLRITVFPPNRRDHIALIALCSMLAIVFFLAALGLLFSRAGTERWVAAIPVLFLGLTIVAAVEIVRVHTRAAFLTVANDYLTFDGPSLIQRHKRWPVDRLAPIHVPFGSPRINGRFVSNLSVGRSKILPSRILNGRDKVELQWIARVLNQEMGKE